MELIREERKRREEIVRKKWDSFIADDEQTLLVLDRDRKAFLTTQQATKEKTDAELASLQDVLRKETIKEEETQQQLKEATETNQVVMDRLQKAQAEKQTTQSTLAEKQLQLQQNEETKTLIVKNMQQKQASCEEELKELKSSIASLQENYRSNLVAVTRLQAETQNDQLQLDDVSRRVLEIQEEEKRLMQVLQEKEAFNASRRSEVDQQKQGVLVAKQVLAEKNRRLVQLNEDLKEQEELYSSEKKLLLQRRATQQVCVVCGIECRKN